MRTNRGALLVTVGMVLLTACASTDQVATTTTAPATTTTSVAGAEISINPPPAPSLPSGLTGDDLFVALEARWMCEIQRFAFPNLDAMSVALDEHLASYGVVRSDYDVFKAAMEDRIDLREQVLAEYDGYCGDD